MALSYIVGYGLGSTGEASGALNGAPTIQSTVNRPGSTGFAQTITGSGGSLDIKVIPTGGVAISSFVAMAFYLRVDALPTAATSIRLAGLGANGISGDIIINSSGFIVIRDAGILHSLTSVNALTANDGVWHQVIADWAASSLSVTVDGVSATGSGTNSSNSTATLGDNVSGANAFVGYLSDVRIYDATAPVVPSTYFTKMLLPTAGNNAASWTDGAGGTGDIHGSVDNVPPTGVAAATASAKIKNAASTGNLDYTATMQSYSVAGIPAGSTINAIMAICNDGEEIVTGTKIGSIWCASNPTQSAQATGRGSFDYGNDTATIVGTYPTGWATHVGAMSISPSVTLATAPTVSVRKITASTRVTDVDFMGLYVDYTPPPIGNLLMLKQAVKRASIF